MKEPQDRFNSTIEPVTKPSPPTAPSVGFISLGCPKNLVDSEVMMGLLDRAGARFTAHPEEAEILVVNTCSFIDTAKQESVDTILEMARHKTSGSAKKLIVAGCLVERYRDEIRKSIPEVDAVVGTGELESILQAAGLQTPLAATPSLFNIISSNKSLEARTAIEAREGQESQAGTHKQAVERGQVLKGHDFSRAANPPKKVGALAPEGTISRNTTPATNPVQNEDSPKGRAEGDHRERQGRFRRDDWQGATHLLPTYLYDETTPRFLTTPKSSAYIKIAEGCDHPCSFCVIPNLRGKFRSRRFESVVAEAQQLVARGVQRDHPHRPGHHLLRRRPGPQRRPRPAPRRARPHRRPALAPLPLRLPQPHHRPTSRHHRQARQHLQIPRPAAPARLARRPQAHEARRQRRDLPQDSGKSPRRRPRNRPPHHFHRRLSRRVLRDLEILEEFIAEAKFDWLGVFNYSDEEGSAAFSLDLKLPRRTIESRRRRLMKLQQSISRRAKQQWVGRELVLLAEGESEETPLLWEGRTQFHAPEIDGKVYINDFGELSTLEPGRFYKAEITQAHDYDVVARILSGPL